MATDPLLRTRVTANGIRLELGGWSYGHGRTVQEAADDLVARLEHHARALRTTGFRFSSEAPSPDRAFLDFLWEIGDIVARGEDVRGRIFRPSEPA
jgi:hypothetical protein